MTEYFCIPEVGVRHSRTFEDILAHWKLILIKARDLRVNSMYFVLPTQKHLKELTGWTYALSKSSKITVEGFNYTSGNSF